MTDKISSARYRERNEILMFKGKPDGSFIGGIMPSVFENFRLGLYERRYKKLKAGSEKWHLEQEKVSNLPSVKIHAKRRALFYMTTLNCGDRLYVHPKVIIYFPQNMTIGNNVFFNRGAFITAREEVIIGNDVLIGPNVMINSGNHNYADKNKLIQEQGHTSKKIVIGDDVWIGGNAVILPGITIGKGAVIAAGAIVTKDVDEYTVVAGIPAKKMKERGSNG
ncbi:MAG: acyltransferase [Methanomassiliicoccaceae archaeon]|jgi:acetyltransferase-like isoleucine patch superfamily enzyme|nr:acyltransferase [Methanomassiliicoccaceae archaeon]